MEWMLWYFHSWEKQRETGKEVLQVLWGQGKVRKQHISDIRVSEFN